jgi:hypothetical protein
MEGPSIDSLGQALNQTRTISRRIAGRADLMQRTETPQDACPVEEGMDESVHCDLCSTSHNPSLPARIACKKQVSKCHRQYLVRDTENSPHRPKQSCLHSSSARDVSLPRISFGQPTINPADEVAIADVTDKEKERQSRLV